MISYLDEIFIEGEGLLECISSFNTYTIKYQTRHASETDNATSNYSTSFLTMKGGILLGLT